MARQTITGKLALCIGLFLILTIGGCASGGNTPDYTGAGLQTETVPVSPFWTGDGGKGKSITILPPRGSGLTENQAYLPDLVANELVSNFNSYSAMTLFDRVNNQKQYDELLSGYYDDNDAAGMDLGHLTSTEYMLLGTITKTSSGYALQLTVNRNSDKTTAASYSGTVSIDDLDNLTGVRRASLDLLQQIGIQVTSQTQTELTKAAETNHVNVQTAIAKGITAQRQGTEVAALSYFFQAAEFDPSVAEITNRVNILAANISSANIGENTRNDIQWRRDWIARLTETETAFYQLLNTPVDPPYSLFYSTSIEQGKINYQTETVDMSIPINMHGIGVWFRSMRGAMQTAYKPVYERLNATNRKSDWGLGNWPQQGVTNTNPFGLRKQLDFTVVFELVNEQGRTISRQTVNMRQEYRFSASGAQVSIDYTDNTFNTVNFTAVKADDITDNLTIRIASVNGAAPENARFKITALSGTEWDDNKNGMFDAFEIENGVVKGFKKSLSNDEIRKYRNLVIPSERWGEVVITSIGVAAFREKELTSVTILYGVRNIGDQAFYNNQLTSVTIPNSVTFIGGAFSFNKLTRVNIPDSVTTIGSGAFAINPISSLTIPSSVTSIGDMAFANNKLTSLTIPGNVIRIGPRAFDSEGNTLKTITIGANVNIIVPQGLALNYSYIKFETFYNKNGRKAGVYTLKGGSWSYSPQ